MEENQPDVVSNVVGIYHADCFDGVAAAWVLLRRFPNLRLIAADYRDPLPEGLEGKDVYIVDFSYEAAVLFGLTAVANHVTLIDHHPRAVEIAEKIPQYTDEDRNILADVNIDLDKLTVYVDKARSGAQLTWDYFFGNPSPYFTCKHMVALEGAGDRADCHCEKLVRPAWLNAVGDRDLWEFKIATTRAICNGLALLPLNPYEWAKRIQMLGMAEFSRRLIEEGQPIQDKIDKDIDRIIEQTQRSIELSDGAGNTYTVPLINVPRSHASEALERLALDHPFAAGYYDDAEFRVFSLRSTKDTGLDTRPIARLYGGDGHVHASGFRAERGTPLAQY